MVVFKDRIITTGYIFLVKGSFVNESAMLSNIGRNFEFIIYCFVNWVWKLHLLPWLVKTSYHYYQYQLHHYQWDLKFNFPYTLQYIHKNHWLTVVIIIVIFISPDLLKCLPFSSKSTLLAIYYATNIYITIASRFIWLCFLVLYVSFGFLVLPLQIDCFVPKRCKIQSISMYLFFLLCRIGRLLHRGWVPCRMSWWRSRYDARGVVWSHEIFKMFAIWWRIWLSKVRWI